MRQTHKTLHPMKHKPLGEPRTRKLTRRRKARQQDRLRANLSAMSAGSGK